MSLAIRDQVQEALKTALKAKEKQRLAAIRLILAAIKQREVDERITLTDEQTIEILQKLQKQRRESIKQYEQASRNDLAAGEAFEFEVISEFLPEPLSESELNQLIEAAIASTGAQSVREMGKVMAEVKKQTAGRADMGTVSQQVKKRLNAS